VVNTGDFDDGKDGSIKSVGPVCGGRRTYIACSAQVHADASNFAPGVTKDQAYKQVLIQAQGLFEGQRNWVGYAQLDLFCSPRLLTDRYCCSRSGEFDLFQRHISRGTHRSAAHSNLSNAASLLWHAYKSLPPPSSSVNWAGFYTIDHNSAKPQLILGPFQGKVACQTIRFGRGVCGAAAQKRETQLVPDVELFPGHIACDGDSRSEIVVPIVSGSGEQERLVAIIDVDCAERDGFDEVDRMYLEELAALIARSSDW
jgi:L-methionine (R)-S-oxide reductase